MRFYILDSEKKNFKAKIKDENILFTDLQISYNEFVRRCKERKHANSYLIADFEIYKSNIKGAKLNNDSDILDYLIIAEFHADDCPEDIGSGSELIRKDNITIKMDGFKQFFRNNYQAMGKMITCVKESIPAEMIIKYKYESLYGIGIKEKVIANTIAVLRSQHDLMYRYPIKNISVVQPEDALNWKEYDEDIIHKAYIFDLKDGVIPNAKPALQEDLVLNMI